MLTLPDALPGSSGSEGSRRMIDKAGVECDSTEESQCQELSI